MTPELPKQYEPRQVQQRLLAFWHERGFFDANPNPAKNPHTIMIPLPNVTGALHMGHALNGTLQDVITRWRRMQGYEALWMPGTDHAGIATQAVVERRMLEEEGKTRHDIGREALVSRIWQWKDEYEARILNQLKQLGASCDWRRTRFTLDEVCSRAVRQTFFRLFHDELIYRGKRLVNWDAYLQTAVADDEVFHETVQGHFWTFTYPILGTAERIAFSTTRPETMLGDTAVAVHPDDERYQKLIGKLVKIPLVDREIPIIADPVLVDRNLGTGCVKVTPAHDPNDYACGRRHKLPLINILNPDGTLNENAGRWQGMDRYQARDSVVAEMEKLGHLVKVEDREIEIAHSDRSKTPIEPYLSDQWFVKMETLAENAMEAVRSGKVKFFPSRYAKTYLDWLGEKRDWCISRQLWWGHRIPVWSLPPSAVGGRVADIGSLNREVFELRDANPEKIAVQQWESSSLPTDGKQPGNARLLIALGPNTHEIQTQLESWGFVQEHDVLDTWFSSALWPHETLGWPNGEPPLKIPPERRRPTVANPVYLEAPESEYEHVGASGLQAAPPVKDLVPETVARSWLVVPISIDADIVTVAMTYPIRADLIEQLREVTKHEIRPVIAAGPDLQAAVVKVYGPESAAGSQQDAPAWMPGMENPVLKYFYPGNVLITSRDIITLWVARMVIMGLYNMRDVPFRHVHVHPKILDGFGQTMSKSKGNGVDPMDLFDKYGVDAVRFTITSFAGENQDVRLPVGYECPHCGEVIAQTLEHQKAIPAGGAKPRLKCPRCKKQPQYSSPWFEADAGEPVARVVSERFEYGRNFCNKLWNASRFALLNLANYVPGPIAENDLQLEDRWILSRLATTARTVTGLLGEYQFDAATRALRDFTWNEFCDWYVEMLKPRLRDDALRPAAQRMLVGVLDVLLRLLSPFTPFLCEELWLRLATIAPERGLLEPRRAAQACLIALWTDLPGDWRDAQLEARFARLQEFIVAVRNVRALYRIEDKIELALHVRCQPDVASQLTDVASQFAHLAKAVLKAAGVDVRRPGASASFSLTDADGFIPLEGVVDRAAELARQKKEAEKIQGFILGNERKLANESFVAKAPPEVVQQVRETLATLRKQLISIEEMVAALED
ncbi:MAG: valine--tRNA ligase [Planctomycetaceae bacterium]